MTLCQLIASGYDLQLVFAMYFAGHIDQSTYDAFVIWYTGKVDEKADQEEREQ
jgi:hypothetical protein